MLTEVESNLAWGYHMPVDSRKKGNKVLAVTSFMQYLEVH